MRTTHYGIGLGTGINLYRSGYIIPVFLDMRGNITKGRVSPHYYCQIGGGIPVYDKSSDDWWGRQDFKASGGLLFDAGFGISVRQSKDLEYVITLGYRSQEVSENYGQGGSNFKDEYIFRRISFQLGLLF